jgi:hypothetical protein
LIFIDCIDYINFVTYLSLGDKTLGPLYTVAKGRDYEIVRALETHPKALLMEN